MEYSHARPSVQVTRPIRGTALVIDDDQWIRSIISVALAEEGFLIEQASDGATGLRMADEVQPDLILLDLALPFRSGLDVLQGLRERQPTRDIPIIIVSAYAMLLIGDDLVRADRLLQKPFDLKELLNHVNQVVREAHPNFRLLPPTRVCA
jgi:two-component system, OmpR family, phosphate regulon response regulator PhoB